jgi:septin family protein
MDIEGIIQSWKPYIDENYLDILKNFFTNVDMKKGNDKMIIIKGEGSTGKTTFLSNMVEYIGQGRVSHISDMISKDLIIVSEPITLDIEKYVIEKINQHLDMKKSMVLICNDIVIPEELQDRVELIIFNHHFTNGLYFTQK